MTEPKRGTPDTGPHTAHLHLDGVRDKATFLDRCARDLDLPEWFGRNWDALDECLRDLSWWGRPSGYEIRVRGWQEFRAAAPDTANTAAEVLADAIAYWSERGTTLTVTFDQG
ncbi:barstar family protein [Streptomyces zagrosensis]|uniref:RNAse (Barnase) inhibitor barstar n=1 Tax=Streptomyces zagrosensis TaxID=1042984 RepID=A0A7W9Q5D8_9ACTN|nr:barstar family protein [Streptomyces zagrosensis]MBB5933741.1 RNAse (barnase) inhibitor barstar [Streptomyces zagrosensis]